MFENNTRVHKTVQKQLHLVQIVNCLLRGNDDFSVKLWDIQQQKIVDTLKGHSNRVWSIAFSPDGRFLASGR